MTQFPLLAVSFVLGLVGLYCAIDSWRKSSQIANDDGRFLKSAGTAIACSAIGAICIVATLLLNHASDAFTVIALAINLLNFAVCKYAFEQRDRVQKEEKHQKAKQQLREEKDCKFVRTVFVGGRPDNLGYVAKPRNSQCRVCGVRIKNGEECWQSHEPREIDLCLVCYEYVFAE